MSIPLNPGQTYFKVVERSGQMRPGIATLAVEAVISGREIMVPLDPALRGLGPVPETLLPDLRQGESFPSG